MHPTPHDYQKLFLLITELTEMYAFMMKDRPANPVGVWDSEQVLISTRLCMICEAANIQGRITLAGACAECGGDY